MRNARPYLCSSFDCLVSTCANFVAYFSYRAEGVKWTTDQCTGISLVIMIGLMARAADTAIEITLARLCPGSEIVLAPPLPISYIVYVTLLCSRHHAKPKLEFGKDCNVII